MQNDPVKYGGDITASWANATGELALTGAANIHVSSPLGNLGVRGSVGGGLSPTASMKGSVVNVGFKDPTISITGALFAGKLSKTFKDSHTLNKRL